MAILCPLCNVVEILISRSYFLVCVIINFTVLKALELNGSFSTDLDASWMIR